LSPKLSILLVAAALGLSACGSGLPSVGAEAGKGTGTKKSDDAPVNESLTAGRSRKTSASSEGARRLFGAMSDTVGFAGVDLETYVDVTKCGGGDIFQIDSALKGIGLAAPEGTVSEAQKALATEKLAKFAPVPGDTQVQTYLKAWLSEGYQHLADGDYDGARVAFMDYLYGVSTASAILAPAWPQATIGLTEFTDGVSGDRFFFDKDVAARMAKDPAYQAKVVSRLMAGDRSKVNGRDFTQCLSGSMALINLSLELQKRWKVELVDRIYKMADDDASRVEVLKLLRSTPIEFLENAAKRQRSFSFRVQAGERQGPLDVLLDGGQRLHADNLGLKLYRSDGLLAFGDALLDGEKVDSSKERSVSIALEERTSAGDGKEANTSTSTKASASLGK